MKVSRLVMGTMNFGFYISEKDCFSMLNKGLESGINFIDTANVYGGGAGRGSSEKIIGNWLKQDKGRRDKIFLATKVYGEMGDGPNQGGLSAYHIRKACEDSLRRLSTDHFDLYQFHHIDLNTTWEEKWQAMEQLVREGKIIYTGSSNFAGWQIAQAQAVASKRNFMGLISEQSIYNLNNRMVELEVLPSCEAHGMGFLAWSPLSGGLLAGVLKGMQKRRRSEEWVRGLLDKNRDKVESYESFCHELGHKPANIALAWLLSNPVLTAPIIGPRTIEQLEVNLESVEIKLSEDVLKKLDDIWPGPGGKAPEAYAW